MRCVHACVCAGFELAGLAVGPSSPFEGAMKMNWLKACMDLPDSNLQI